MMPHMMKFWEETMQEKCRHRPKYYFHINVGGKKVYTCKKCGARIKASGLFETLLIFLLFTTTYGLIYLFGLDVKLEAAPLVFILPYFLVLWILYSLIYFVVLPFYEIDKDGLPVNVHQIAAQAGDVSCRHRPAFSLEYVSWEHRAKKCRCQKCGKRIKAKSSGFSLYFFFIMPVIAGITLFLLLEILRTTSFYVYFGLIGIASIMIFAVLNPLVFFYLLPFHEVLAPPTPAKDNDIQKQQFSE